MEFKARDCIAISGSGVMSNYETGDSYSLYHTGLHIINGLKKIKQKEEIMLSIPAQFEKVDKRTFEKDFYDLISSSLSYQIIKKAA